MAPLLATLTAMAREAAEAILRARSEGLTVFRKPGGETVTSADLASREAIASRRAEWLPAMPLISEEGGSRRIRSGPMLVADELDGTAPFAAGSPQWGVMLAVIEGLPTHAVIVLPDLDVVIAAQKGQGCTLNGRRVILPPERQPDEVLLGLELNKTMRASDWQRVQHAARLFRAVRCTASAAASAHELLTGITDAYLNIRGGKLWDFAAIGLAISEAGGTATTPDGQPLEWNAIPMRFLATAGRQLLKRMLAAGPPANRRSAA